MKIGINGYEAIVSRFGYDAKTSLPNRVGSGEFCFQLLVSLSKIDKKNEYYIYLPKEPTEDMPPESKNWHYVIFPGKLWTLVGLSKKLWEYRNKVNVFFSPTHYLPFVTTKPSVIAILDVSYLHFPELFKKKDLYKLKVWGKYSIGKAKAVVTISESSKNDIINAYKIPGDNVFVTYPGIKFGTQKNKVLDKGSFEKKYKISDYILFVGTLQPRKNLVRLIESFSQIKDKKIKLAIVGRKGWLYEDILKAPDKFGVSDRVMFFHGIEDSELADFYRNAKCFVLPSLYEGFGLPVLEAMKYGCPVVLSEISSLPEAGGEAAIYFNPQDTEDIAEKIDKVLSSEELRNKMIKKGFEQIKKFSWDHTARDVLKVIEGLK